MGEHEGTRMNTGRSIFGLIVRGINPHEPTLLDHQRSCGEASAVKAHTELFSPLTSGSPGGEDTLTL